MSEVIVTTNGQLEEFIKKAIHDSLNIILAQQTPSEKKYPGQLNIDQASEYLKGLGYKVSKGQLYKETFNKTISFHKFGKNIIFTQEELLDWVSKRVKDPKKVKSEVINAIANNARKKVAA